MRQIVITVLLITVSLTAFGQTPSFSISNIGLSNNNPAFTGVSAGQYHTYAGYRSQYSGQLEGQAIQAAHFGADAKFHIDNDDFYAIGVNLQTDQSGIAQYQGSHLNIQGSYIKKLDGSKNGRGKYLSMGLNAGIMQYRGRKNNLWYGNQFDTDRYLLELGTSSGESSTFLDGNATPTSPDIGVGVLFYEVLGGRKNYYVGISMDHILKPNVSLTGGSERLPYKFTVTAGGEKPINRELSALPTLVVRVQGTQQIYQTGAQVRMKSSDRKDLALRFGTHFRFVNAANFNAESLILSFGLEYGDFIAGMAYDLSIGPISQLSRGNGAFEFAVGYQFPYTRRKTGIFCPKF